MSKQRGRRVTDGVLAGHYQIGRRFVPEIIAKVDPEFSDWIKTDLPDLLWPMILVHIHGYKGIVSLRSAQQDVYSHIKALPHTNNSNMLDGRLTSLEQVRSSDREGIIRTLRQAPYRDRLFSPEIKGVLSLFECAPGYWLLAKPWNHQNIPSEDESRSLLGDAIFKVITDGHANALTKVPTLIWLTIAGRLNMPKKYIDELVQYPNNLDMRPKTDALIRSSFGAIKAMPISDEIANSTANWSDQFWAENHRSTPCYISTPAVRPDARRDNREAAEPIRSTNCTKKDEEQSIKSILENFTRRLQEEYSLFMAKAVSSEYAMDPTDVERFEVVTGLVSRCFRSLVIVFQSPLFWNSEHGSDIVRTLFETEITLLWLHSHSGERSYKNYQDYGKGKGKLFKLHLERLIHNAGGIDYNSLAGTVSDGDLSNGNNDQFQEISLANTFAGISLRKMAEEVGQIDQYRYVYQPASGMSHGEWWTLEGSVMVHCVNPLHRFHLIPSGDASPEINAQFPAATFRAFQRIIAAAATSLCIDMDEQTDESHDDHADDPSESAGGESPTQV